MSESEYWQWIESLQELNLKHYITHKNDLTIHFLSSYNLRIVNVSDYTEYWEKNCGDKQCDDFVHEGGECRQLKIQFYVDDVLIHEHNLQEKE